MELRSVSNMSKDEKAKVMAFSCGENDIDNYLKEEAVTDHICNLTRTFILYHENKMIGYFSLTTDKALLIKKSKVRTYLPSHPFYEHKSDSIPAIQIHHFAIAKELQGLGWGRLLFTHLLTLIKINVLPHIGASLLTVYSLKNAKEFYKKIGFEKTGKNSSSNVNMALVLSEVL